MKKVVKRKKSGKHYYLPQDVIEIVEKKSEAEGRSPSNWLTLLIRSAEGKKA